VGRLPENFADLVEHWTLLPVEADLLAGKHDGASKLAFALLLKFYGRYGRFPRGRRLDRRGVPALASRSPGIRPVARLTSGSAWLLTDRSA